MKVRLKTNAQLVGKSTPYPLTSSEGLEVGHGDNNNIDSLLDCNFNLNNLNTCQGSNPLDLDIYEFINDITPIIEDYTEISESKDVYQNSPMPLEVFSQDSFDMTLETSFLKQLKESSHSNESHIGYENQIMGDVNRLTPFSNLSSSSSLSSPDLEDSTFKPDKFHKKEQNKYAALKYRKKKKMEHNKFLSEWQQLERKNSELKTKHAEILKEINYLKTLMCEITSAD